MDDTWFEVPELAAEVARDVRDGSVKVTYTAGPAYREQSGRPAALWIGISNSSLNGGAVEAMEALAEQLVPMAVRWLRDHQLAFAETSIQVCFADEWKFGPLMGFNSLEAFLWELNDLAEAARVETASAAFRKFRYGMSGRTPPPK